MDSFMDQLGFLMGVLVFAVVVGGGLRLGWETAGLIMTSRPKEKKKESRVGDSVSPPATS